MGIAEFVVAVVLVVFFAVLVGLYISTYNRFVKLRNASIATLGQVRVALRKRLDLITSLAEAVGSYAKFERETLESVTKMRASISSASPEDIARAERETRSLLARFLAVVERYPELRTAEVVRKLMETSREVEEEIARHRYTYNNIVQEYNTMVDTIPSRFVALIHGFQKLPYLEVGEEVGRRPSLAFYGGRSEG